jgi:hypothetical protein
VFTNVTAADDAGALVVGALRGFNLAWRNVTLARADGPAAGASPLCAWPLPLPPDAAAVALAQSAGSSSEGGGRALAVALPLGLGVPLIAAVGAALAALRRQRRRRRQQPREPFAKPASDSRAAAAAAPDGLNPSSAPGAGSTQQQAAPGAGTASGAAAGLVGARRLTDMEAHEKSTLAKSLGPPAGGGDARPKPLPLAPAAVAGADARPAGAPMAGLRFELEARRPSLGQPQAPAASHGTPLSAGSEPAANGGWRRLSSAIGALSLDLQQRRLAASLAPAAGVRPAGSGDLQGARTPARAPSAAARRASSTTTGGGASTDLDAVAGSSAGTARGSGSGLRAPSPGSGRLRSSRESASSGGAAASLPAPPPQLQLHELLGRGTFGQVWRATWKGAAVAVKIINLPAGGTGDEGGGGGGGAGSCGAGIGGGGGAAGAAAGGLDFARAHPLTHLAVREAAISASVSHPHVVTVYTYTLRPVTIEDAELAGEPSAAQGLLLQPAQGTGVVGGPLVAAGGGSGGVCGGGGSGGAAVVAWELRLIMEFMELVRRAGPEFGACRRQHS